MAPRNQQGQHKCPDCDKAFSSKPSLKAHELQQHERGEWSLCRFCHRQFADATCRNKHQRGCSKRPAEEGAEGESKGRKAYYCTLCNKWVGRSDNAHRHARTKHDNDNSCLVAGRQGPANSVTPPPEAAAATDAQGTVGPVAAATGSAALNVAAAGQSQPQREQQLQLPLPEFDPTFLMNNGSNPDLALGTGYAPAEVADQYWSALQQQQQQQQQQQEQQQPLHPIQWADINNEATIFEPDNSTPSLYFDGVYTWADLPNGSKMVVGQSAGNSNVNNNMLLADPMLTGDMIPEQQDNWSDSLFADSLLTAAWESEGSDWQEAAYQMPVQQQQQQQPQQQQQQQQDPVFPWSYQDLSFEELLNAS